MFVVMGVVGLACVVGGVLVVVDAGNASDLCARNVGEIAIVASISRTVNTI